MRKSKRFALVVFTFSFQIIFLAAFNLAAETCTELCENISWNDSLPKEIVFTPDSSINSQLILDSPKSIISTLGDISKLCDSTADFPDIYFKTASSTYLRIVFFPGGSRNSVMKFEVGNSEQITNKIYNKINFNSLQTESAIEIGNSKSMVIDKKGKAFTTIPSNEYEIIRYKIENIAYNSFLKYHNMPLYFAEYSFKKDRLVKFIFGFEYP